MGNQIRGNYVEAAAVSIRVYDVLPAEVRQVMRNAIHIMAATPRLKKLRAGASVASVIEQTMQNDVEASRRDAAIDWCDQAAEYLAAQRPRRRLDWLDKPPRSRL